GLGVVIGIVDDGVQLTHPDLAPNLSLTLSTGFNTSTATPLGSAAPLQLIPCNPALLGAVLGDGCRGTAIAGLAASRYNPLGGRGTIIVRAAGDGGATDNCNFDGFASHRFVLAVGAVGDDALPAPYGEACSALFVAAPSSGGARSITTTDLLGNPGYDPAAGD